MLLKKKQLNKLLQNIILILNNNKNLSGFTLTELAVSITIIGLLISSIIAGFSMVQSAKLRRLTTEFTQIFANIDLFNQLYSYYPGDMPNASDFWSSVNNGNGNKTIDYSPTEFEDLYFWQHLSAAEILPGNFTGDVISPLIRYEIGINSKKSSPYSNGGFMYRTEATAIYGFVGNALRFGKVDSNGELLGGIFTAKDAYSIDIKLDDGKADSGMFTSLVGTGQTGCVLANEYALDDNNKSCNMSYWHDKF